MVGRSWKAFRSTRFLSQDDFPSPEVVTIIGADTDEVTGRDGKPKVKLLLPLKEKDKPFVCNPKNAAKLEKMFGSEFPDHWVGRQFEMYVDPDVQYGNEQTGGLRVRPVPMMRMQSHKPVPTSAGKSMDEVNHELAASAANDEIPY